MMPKAPSGEPNRWLTCILIDSDAGIDTETLRLHLEEANIESRPVWKPMHMQPAFDECQVLGGAVAEKLFATGLCLPSGSVLTDQDVERVIERVYTCPGLNLEASV